MHVTATSKDFYVHTTRLHHHRLSNLLIFQLASSRQLLSAHHLSNSSRSSFHPQGASDTLNSLSSLNKPFSFSALRSGSPELVSKSSIVREASRGALRDLKRLVSYSRPVR